MQKHKVKVIKIQWDKLNTTVKNIEIPNKPTHEKIQAKQIYA